MIAVFLGTLILGEALSPRLAVAGGIVLVGMALVKGRTDEKECVGFFLHSHCLLDGIAERECHRAFDDALSVNARDAFEETHAASQT